MPSSVETQTATVQSWQLGTPVLANQLRGSSVSLVALVKETTVQEVQSDTSSTSTNTASSGASPDSDQEHAGVVAADKELEAQASTLVRSSPPQPQPQLEEQQQQAQDQELEQPPAAPANERGTSKTSDAVGGSAPQTTTTPGASAIKAAADTERTTTSGKGKDKTRGKRDRGGKDTNNIQGRGAEDGTASGPRKGPLTRMLRKIKMGFFSRKKKEAEANPYAKDVPYSNPMTPYQQARNNVAQGMSASGQPTSDAPPAYNSPSVASSGFGDNKFGSQSGYGSNRYGQDAPQAQPAGGYGGFDNGAGKNDLFGGAASRPGVGNQTVGNSAPALNNRDPALFGNAQNRYNPVNTSQSQGQPGGTDDEYGGYGAARELTEEEKEEQEIQGTKNEIKAVRQAGIESLDRTIATGNAAIDQLMSSRMRLAQQEERLRNAEKNLDVAAIHAKDGTDKTKTLDKLNRTPFFIPVGQGKKARTKEVEATMERHREEKDIREQTRHEAFADRQRMEETTKQVMRDPIGIKQLGARKPANDRFKFEEDDEDNEQEEELGDRLGGVGVISETLKELSGYMTEDLVRSNQGLDRISNKVDRVDDNVRKNRAMLNQIR